jgi:hypothetical protein
VVGVNFGFGASGAGVTTGSELSQPIVAATIKTKTVRRDAIDRDICFSLEGLLS